jgi:hypothetical protein
VAVRVMIDIISRQGMTVCERRNPQKDKLAPCVVSTFTFIESRRPADGA